jgi:predicted nucleic acid-binding protein
VKNDRIVVNASPVIVLFKADLAYLLPHLFTDILIPGAVWDEVIAGGQMDAAANQLPTVDWIKRVEVAAIASNVAACDLGQGEAEVLTVALNHPGYRVVIDDAAARRCAHTLQLPMLGTGGIIVMAKRRGLIPSIEPCLQKLRDAGLWLSDEVSALLTKQANE